MRLRAGTVKSRASSLDAVSSSLRDDDVDCSSKYLVPPFEKTQALMGLPRTDDQLDGVLAGELADEVRAPSTV